MDEKEKIARAINAVEELGNSLKNLAESAKEKSADIRSFAKVLRETENLFTIDPETLRPVSEWELNPYRFSCEHFRCKKCHHIDCVADKYCGECGSKMKNAGVKPEDMPIPTETIQKSNTSPEWTAL